MIEYIMPSTVFDVDGIPDWGGPLLSVDSANAPNYNHRPENKVAKQAYG